MADAARDGMDSDKYFFFASFAVKLFAFLGGLHGLAVKAFSFHVISIVSPV